ncbi:MAG: hemolysin family protein [Candidatus Omnitrophota bacterium]|nr:hemolysin family protein [Candidatus Omnitrophota bacterium]
MIQLVLLVIFLALSAFFSSSEAALFSLNKLHVRKISISSPGKGKVISHLLDFPRRTLITILIGNMVVNIGFASTATFLLMRLLGNKGVGVAIAVVTFLLLVFGEVTPKLLAIKNPEKFSSFCAKPLEVFARIIFPVRKVLGAISDSILSLFIKDIELKKPFVTQKELKNLVSISQEQGVLEREEKDMIESLLEFGEREVQEIMVPRTDIVACDIGASWDTLANLMKDSLHTRIPIYQGSLDNIIGIILTKDFMLSPHRDLKKFVRPVAIIPESKKIDDLLIELRAKKLTLAAVIDEYGGTAGLVTKEDILEEIVGEIYDEYDKVEKPIEHLDQQTVMVSGKLSIKDVNEELRLHLPLDRGETLSGLLLSLFGHIPLTGEKLNYRDLQFKIEDVKKRRINKVTILKLKEK